MLNAAQRSSILHTANRLSGGDAAKVPADQRAGLIQDVSKELSGQGISKAQVREALFEAWTGVNEDKGQKAVDLTGGSIAGFSADAGRIETSSSKGFSPIGLRMAASQELPSGNIKSVLEPEMRKLDLGLHLPPNLGSIKSAFKQPTPLEVSIQLKPDQAAQGLEGLRGMAGEPGELKVSDEKHRQTTDVYYDTGTNLTEGVVRLRTNREKSAQLNFKPLEGKGDPILRRVEVGLDLSGFEPEMEHLQMGDASSKALTDTKSIQALRKATQGLVAKLFPEGVPQTELVQKKWDRERTSFDVEGFGASAQVDVLRDQIGDGEPRFSIELTGIARGDGDAFVKLTAAVMKPFNLDA